MKKGFRCLRGAKKCFFLQNVNWNPQFRSRIPAMLGNTSGFASLFKKDVPNSIISHCFLHRYALFSQTLPIFLNVVMSTCFEISNFIRAITLTSAYL